MIAPAARAICHRSCCLEIAQCAAGVKSGLAILRLRLWQASTGKAVTKVRQSPEIRQLSWTPPLLWHADRRQGLRDLDHAFRSFAGQVLMIRVRNIDQRSPLIPWRSETRRRGMQRLSFRRGTRSLADSFLATAHIHAGQLALVTETAEFTYADLRRHVSRFAETLYQLPGWTSGERVGIRLGNGIDYIVAFYGTLLAGGIAIPLPREQRAEWVAGVLEKTVCRWIIDETSGNQVVPSGVGPANPPTAAELPTLAAIFFTSGSSGEPKGVMLSHTNLIANAASIVKSLPLRSSDRALAVLPFCHAYGNSVLQSHLLSGATLVIAGSPTFPESLVETMRNHAVTSFAGVPDLHRLLLRGSSLSAESVPTLRYATVAGGALQPALAQQVAERIEPAEFYVMYGQTEATARLSCLPAREWSTRRGSIGRGIPDVTLEVVDAQGRPVEPGETGELRAAGPNIMAGYWNDAGATQQCLRDGWLYTGDLATIDADGYIYPCGRNSQLLKIGGYRIHPAEIEAVMAARFPMCDPVVVPYETQDGFTRLAMFLTPAAAAPMPSVSELRQHCQDHLPRHQRPDLIEFLDSPPLTASLKVDRQALSRRATGQFREQNAPAAPELCHA